ncbi:MAG: hypothetical protein WBC18_19890 [Ottowia sp.]|uniref:hypothetical protein n=1 Tax=unclassified Ottowia TaxID=2645081 RepID=UPI003C2B7080
MHEKSPEKMPEKHKKHFRVRGASRFQRPPHADEAQVISTNDLKMPTSVTRLFYHWRQAGAAAHEGHA